MRALRAQPAAVCGPTGLPVLASLHAAPLLAPGLPTCATPPHPASGHAGVWRASDKRCWFRAPNKGITGSTWTNYYATSGYSCVCLNTQVASWYWGASTACLSGASAASSSPTACRFHKNGDLRQWTMGWITSADGYCYSPNTYFGAGGALLNAVRGIGGPTYGMQLLCRKGAPQGARGADRSRLLNRATVANLPANRSKPACLPACPLANHCLTA